MDIITGKIGSGKTVELITMAYKDKGTIVAMNKNQAEAIKFTCKDMSKKLNDSGYNYIPIITYDNFLNIRGKHNINYYIDNIEYFLERIFPSQIKGCVCDAENIFMKELIIDSEGTRSYPVHKLVN